MLKYVVLAATLGVCTPVFAQQLNCGPREQAVAGLAKKYGESLEHTGLLSSTTVMEVWSNHETGTWTVLTTTPDGTTCFISSGQYWSSFEPTPQGDPS